MTRRRFTEREVLECLIRQGAVIPCKRCRTVLLLSDIPTVEREHAHEIALDGADTVENCFYSHGPCHSAITNGLPATSAGSSKNRIAKATQPTRIEKFQVKKIPLDADLVSEPSGRCRRCGQDPCDCRAPVKRSAFGGRR